MKGLQRCKPFAVFAEGLVDIVIVVPKAAFCKKCLKVC